MFQPSEETAHTSEFESEYADYFGLEETPEFDFIPDDPAGLRCAVTDMAARINLADWRFIKLIAAMGRTRGWNERGYCNLGNWLDHRCGLGPCAAGSASASAERWPGCRASTRRSATEPELLKGARHHQGSDSGHRGDAAGHGRAQQRGAA